MSTLVSVLLFVFDITNGYDSCPILEDTACSDILYERHGLTIEQYRELPPLHKFILQDSVDCVTEGLCPVNLDEIIGEEIKCEYGVATDLEYPCHNVDLLSFIPLTGLGSNVNASGNDIWGWTQYDDNDNYIAYYALTGQTDGTSIVDITDPINPNVLAFIESNVFPLRHISWRDIKTYNEYAFVVADAKPQDDHHLQIFNIQNIINDAKQYQIENGDDSILIINNQNENVLIYNDIGYSHNVFINEESGYLYSVGVADCDGRIGGAHIVDITDPLNPEYAGCYSGVRYVHDIQCVIYHGPDIEYFDHEICFAFAPSRLVFNEETDLYESDMNDTLTFIDVTDKNNIIEISKTSYNYSAYNHQGWVTNSHEYLLMDDELDEYIYRDDVPTQVTFIWDIRDLKEPILVNKYDSNLTVIDHNQYIIDNGKQIDDNEFKGFVFQSNYEAGLRILNIDNIANGEIYEIAYFDNYIWIDANSTSHDTVEPRGSWSVYPYFKPNKNKNEFSDVVVVQNINTGLYVLRHNINVNHIFVENNEENNNQTLYIVIGIICGVAIIIILIITYYYRSRKNKSTNTNQELSALIDNQ